jgi:hypothetical protein
MNHDPCLPVYDTASGATGGVTEQSKDGKHMKGIQFVVDDRGEKTAVLINLQEHGDLWEDFYDCLIARARADSGAFVLVITACSIRLTIKSVS